jgi:hypothetical protein
MYCIKNNQLISINIYSLKIDENELQKVIATLPLTLLFFFF